MPTSISTKDIGKLVLPAEDLPVKLSIGIRGTTHEATTTLACGATEYDEQHNAFDLELGKSHALYGKDLMVRSRIQDIDPLGDKVTYLFSVTCGASGYSYEKTYTFQPEPKKGQWVRFNTVLSFRKP